jgi:hypothetical protein
MSEKISSEILVSGSFQRSKSRLQCFEFFASATQDPGLDIEFLARHKIQFRKTRLQDGFEVGFEIATNSREAFRNAGRKPSGEVVDASRIHGVSLG